MLIKYTVEHPMTYDKAPQVKGVIFPGDVLYSVMENAPPPLQGQPTIHFRVYTNEAREYIVVYQNKYENVILYDEWEKVYIKNK